MDHGAPISLESELALRLIALVGMHHKAALDLVDEYSFLLKEYLTELEMLSEGEKLSEFHYYFNFYVMGDATLREEVWTLFAHNVRDYNFGGLKEADLQAVRHFWEKSYVACGKHIIPKESWEGDFAHAAVVEVNE